uniref:Uncharacterized protein n=1 Tax=Rhizophora mucronata TaxID=61149 RepID=A0A2P2IN92_RHIMU
MMVWWKEWHNDLTKLFFDDPRHKVSLLILNL